jgi:hypothetical protein
MNTPDMNLIAADREAERHGREAARDAWVEAHIPDWLADPEAVEEVLRCPCTDAEEAAWEAALAVALESYRTPTTDAQAALLRALEQVAREDVEADLRDHEQYNTREG